MKLLPLIFILRLIAQSNIFTFLFRHIFRPTSHTWTSWKNNVENGICMCDWKKCYPRLSICSMTEWAKWAFWKVIKRLLIENKNRYLRKLSRWLFLHLQHWTQTHTWHTTVTVHTSLHCYTVWPSQPSSFKNLKILPRRCCNVQSG